MSHAGKTIHPGKTNAVRQLDALGIHYELRSYEVDPDDLTAVSGARKIGLPAEQAFKTLVTQTAEGERKVELVALKDVEPLTGYIRGGVTVLAAKKPFPAFADEAIELFDVISVSAGQRGLQIVLAPTDYLRATNAKLADLTKTSIPGGQA